MRIVLLLILVKYLQFMSSWTVVASGLLILLLDVSHVSSAPRSDLANIDIVKSFFITPSSQQSLVSMSFPFRYQTTRGGGLPAITKMHTIIKIFHLHEILHSVTFSIFNHNHHELRYTHTLDYADLHFTRLIWWMPIIKNVLFSHSLRFYHLTSS